MTLTKALIKQQQEEPTRLRIVGDELDAWVTCLKDAEAHLDKTLEGEDFDLYFKDEAFADGLIKTIAENLALERGVCPPSFTHVLECENCGFMPSDIVTTTVLKSCPWCHTKFGGTRRLLDTNADFLEFEANHWKDGTHKELTFKKIKELRKGFR